jgi:hypothetical protein
MLGPQVTEDRSKLFGKMNALGNSLWSMHAKVKKQNLEEEASVEVKEEQKNYKFPSTPAQTVAKTAGSGLCDYSSSEEEDGDDESSENEN